MTFKHLQGHRPTSARWPGPRERRSSLAATRPATASTATISICRFLGSLTGSPTSSPTPAYAATLLHELVHWTGAAHRLDRGFGEGFDREKLARSRDRRRLSLCRPWGKQCAQS